MYLVYFFITFCGLAKVGFRIRMFQFCKMLNRIPMFKFSRSASISQDRCYKLYYLNTTLTIFNSSLSIIAFKLLSINIIKYKEDKFNSEN